MTSAEKITVAELRAGLVTMLPSVAVGGMSLKAEALARLLQVEVDSHLHLPDMFTLTFDDPDHEVLTLTGLKLGSRVQVKGGVADQGGVPTLHLVSGEVTAIEGTYSQTGATTVVRGYTLDHRLQRVRRTRSFVNMSDSEAAAQIAQEAGLTRGQIDASQPKHPQLGQWNTSDWAFISERAREIGFEVGVRDDKFYFRKVGSGPATPIEVTLDVELLRFAPRVSVGNLTAEAEVRAWDPVSAKVVATRKPTASPEASVGAGDPAEALGPFKGPTASPASPGSNDAGPPPGAAALVLHGHGLTLAGGNSESVDAAAAALAQRATSGFAEARGEMFGDARIIAGAKLKIGGVSGPFSGTWAVTSARHVFDRAGGYRTFVQMSGRADRSLLALTTGAAESAGKTVPGVVCGLVTDVDDPLGLGRVKVALPWLAPDYETDWAPVSQLGASAAGGAMFLPSPKDQVLVAFEHGDMRRPYVLGSVVNDRTGAGGTLTPGGTKPGKTAVKAGRPASVIRRGFVAPSGSRLVFHDELPPSGGKPTAAQIVLGTDRDKISLTLDQVAGTLDISCSPGSPPGRLSITCDGNVEIKAGPSGTLSIDGGAQLSLKGKAVNIEGSAAVTVKGKPIMLN